MTTIEEHKRIAKIFLEDIDEKIRANLVTERQKIIGFSASEAAVNLFSILLHKQNLVEPGFNMNHRYFASERIAEKTFNFEFSNKKELLQLLVNQEDFRNRLCYGKEKSSEMVDSAVKNLFRLKNLIVKASGEEL